MIGTHMSTYPHIHKDTHTHKNIYTNCIYRKRWRLKIEVEVEVELKIDTDTDTDKDETVPDDGDLAQDPDLDP